MDVQHDNKIKELKEALDKALLEGGRAEKHYLDLGDTYNESYQQTHQQEDLENAVMCYETGLQVGPIGRETHWYLFNNLGLALCARYKQVGSVNDLERSITCLKQALDLSPPGHPNRPISLNNLGLVLRSRYTVYGEMEDLKRCLICHKQVLDLHPLGHPNRSIALNNLALSLQAKYEQLGDMTSLGNAITCYEQALELRPTGHPNRPMSLNNLANALKVRYEQLGKMEDLERSINYHEQVLDLWLPGHPLRSGSLNNLAITLQDRYDHLGSMEDLQKAVTYHEQALELRPLGHPDRSVSLNNLANALNVRYNWFGKIEDMDKTITCHEEALGLHLLGHSQRSHSLNNLANALRTRYKHIGEIKDLEKCIACYQQALDLHLHGNPFRPMSLSNLAIALQIRYEQLKKMEDLEKAIICHKEALDLHPPGHINRSASLDGFATALQTRFQQLQEIEDLEEAINFHAQALNLRPPGHPNRPTSLYNLATALHMRYKKLGKLENLEKAIACLRESLDLHPPDHPMRVAYLNNLAISFEARYMLLGETKDLILTVACCEQAACHETSSLPDRLIAAKHWAIKAHTYGFGSAISAYSLALDLQQQHLALLPSITSQQKLVEKSSWLALDAASCAISNGMPEMAVQLLEQGRSILWSKIEGYSHSLTKISEKAPKLAEEFQILSKQLEHNAISNDTNITLQRTLSEKWKNMLEEIRKIDGFSDYLQVPSFNTLRDVSIEGPVVMINISYFRSDAIILTLHSSPIVVSLHDTSPQILNQLVGQLSKATTSPDNSKYVCYVLRHLWHAIVKPVVEQLAQLKVAERSHIWWCPTSYLCALPLHAAGPYRKGVKNLPDLYISSYTPTLRSLIRARLNISKPQSSLNLLLVSQPDDTIPYVFEEAEVIKNFKKPVSLCSGHNADKKGVLSALQSHSWAHFACHGHLEEQPFNSWFQLYNKEHLTVLDLAMAKLPNAEFAFLSACHSAAGNIHGTPDESIHLAGAMQFSGFRSVVGTLWAMTDDDGPSIANAFYRYMFQDPDNVDLRNAAAALNFATRELRKQGVPLDRWINFIHIGV
ncbi:TPR-like protein [Collybia nuda]|uniref:TPR-like protein n=1 Tax=Collybia nuda TaxID=64659 RepID=A0A9P6C8V4_9AGAR|nr:TPR-like protein [Collybia nuda]